MFRLSATACWNWINPFQFAAYKDKVDHKKRRGGAAIDPQAQVGFPVRTSLIQTKQAALRGTHELHTHAFCKMMAQWKCIDSIHHSALLMFDFLLLLICGCLSRSICHLRELTLAACLQLIEGDGDRVTFSCAQQQTIYEYQLDLTLMRLTLTFFNTSP